MGGTSSDLSNDGRGPGTTNLIGKIEEKDRITFDLSDDYCRWTLPSVIAAFQRFEKLKERRVELSVAAGGGELEAGNNKFLVSRREFWEYEWLCPLFSLRNTTPRMAHCLCVVGYALCVQDLH